MRSPCLGQCERAPAALLTVAGDVPRTTTLAPVEGGVAPMSLSTYEEARPWARAIKQRTGIGPKAGVMPPWYVEKNIGIQQFQNELVIVHRYVTQN